MWTFPRPTSPTCWRVSSFSLTPYLLHACVLYLATILAGAYLVTGLIIAGCCLLAGAAYRTAGGESYGAKAFMGVLNDVFGKDEKKGKLQLAASQVAFVELGVSWHSHTMP